MSYLKRIYVSWEAVAARPDLLETVKVPKNYKTDTAINEFLAKAKLEHNQVSAVTPGAMRLVKITALGDPVDQTATKDLFTFGSAKEFMAFLQARVLSFLSNDVSLGLFSAAAVPRVFGLRAGLMAVAMCYDLWASGYDNTVPISRLLTPSVRNALFVDPHELLIRHAVAGAPWKNDGDRYLEFKAVIELFLPGQKFAAEVNEVRALTERMGI